jgi:hypothetical protein
LQRYDPWFTEFGRGDFHRGFYATCTHLEPIENYKIVNTPIEEFAPVFESLYYELLTGDKQLPLKYNSNAGLPWSYEFTDDVCTEKIMKDNEDEKYVNTRRSWWKTISEVDINLGKDAINSAVKSLVPAQKSYAGRGIVFTGTSAFFIHLKIAVKALLHYGCILPIEIWFYITYCRHKNDFDEIQQEQLRKYPNVFVKNINDFTKKRVVGPPETYVDIRAASIIYSQLDEILYLDPVVFPVRDPSFLFDSAAFQQTGAIFWKTYWRTSMDNRIFDIFDLPCTDEFQQDSGMLMIKKTTSGVFKALNLAMHIEMNSKYYSNFFDGGNDIYRFAWRKLAIPYHMVLIHLIIGSNISGSSWKND